MLEDIMYLVSNAFKVYVIARFFEHFFKPKEISKWLRYTSFLGYFLINSGLYLLFDSNYLNLASNIVPLFGITFLYAMKFQNRIFFSIGILAVLLFVEGIVANISCLIFPNTTILDINVELDISLYLIELLIENKKIYISNNCNIQRLHFVAIIFVVGGSLMIGTLTMRGYSVYIVIVTVILLLINVTIFLLYDIISKTQQELYEKRVLEQQNIAYNNQIKLWKDNQKATQTLKHDMKNHLIELKTTLANGDYQKLDKYISTMMSSLEVREEYVKSGNVSVDSILNYKLKEIKSLTDNVTYSITIPSDIFVSAFDLNIILGNLLDNSIEALVKCNNSDRAFNFQMEYAQGIIKISVENSYEGQVHQQNNTFKTTKSDSNLHGIGIESVKNTIAKYNGIIQFDTDGAIFKVKILLCEDGFKV
jgi:hypothetical protein